MYGQSPADQPLTLNDQASPTSNPGSTYTSLFSEDWNTLCLPSSLTAIDGPVAYLHVLYQFALNLESSGQGHRDKITLDQRRPDLKALQIDAQGLTQTISQLSIVNDTLSHHLNTHLQSSLDAFNGLSIDEALKRQRYPFLLPFDRAHLQCQLCLAQGKPELGELNYRISLQLPLSQAAQNRYGVVLQEAHEAQLLLSGLSPARQVLLTADFERHTAEGSPQRRAFFTRHYGADETDLQRLDTWLAHTELSADQTQALFACGKYRPQRSASVTLTSTPTGARYVNGLSEVQAGLDLSLASRAGVRLLNTSFNRFERLHRMIRLQRWLQVPFDELDTLLWSVWRRDPQVGPAFELNTNSLRALGVWRYLNQRYNLPVEAFSAILHEIPVQAPAHRMSLYDQLFSASVPLQPLLRVDLTPLKLKVDEPQHASTRHLLCAGLGVKDTPDSLHWMMSQSQRYLPAHSDTLTLLSSLYRQARIATLFDLSIVNSHDLAELLAGEAFTRQLVQPSLRAAGSNAPPDMLDVLMQMDWLVNWLKHSQQTVPALRRQLLLGDQVLSPKLIGVLKHLHELVELIGNGLVKPADIDEMELPQPEPQTGKPPINWHALIVQGLLRSFPQLPDKKTLRELPARLLAQIDNLTFSVTANTDNERKTDAKAALSKKLTTLYQQLTPLKEQFNGLFSSSAFSYDPDLLSVLLKHTARLIAQAGDAALPGPTLKHVLLMLPDAETLLELPVGRDVLHRFLQHPHWLDSDYKAGTPLPLSLKTLYLLQRFEHALKTYGLTQDALLDYLQWANAKSTGAIPHQARAQANSRLATLFDWTASEITQLTQRLPDTHAHTVAHLDWIMRCQENGRLTGLSVSSLLQATDLSGNVSSSTWQQVADALIANAR